MPELDTAFYFDLASPLAYLAAEQVLHVLPGPAEWQPVLARDLEGEKTSTPVAASASEEDLQGEAKRLEEDEKSFRKEVERRARELRLQPLRWPEPFPFDSALAMRVATYAKSIGRAVPFAQAAFRQAFAGGRRLDEADNVLTAAAACEMHPAAVLRGAELRSVDVQLSEATAAAARAGVHSVPAVIVGEHVFHGDRALEEAASRMVLTSPAIEMR